MLMLILTVQLSKLSVPVFSSSIGAHHSETQTALLVKHSTLNA